MSEKPRSLTQNHRKPGHSNPVIEWDRSFLLNLEDFPPLGLLGPLFPSLLTCPHEPSPEAAGLFQGTQSPLVTIIWQLAIPAVGLFPTTLRQGTFSRGSHSFSEMSHLRLGVQKDCQLPMSPLAHGEVAPLGAAWSVEAAASFRQHSHLLRSPFWLLPVPVLPLSCVGGSPVQGWACAAQLCFLFWLPLLLVALEVYRAGEGLPGGLGTKFLLCVRMCVLSCSRFDFEGLESGDDGAFDKLRSWSRSIEDLQPPSALSAPFTNSLARSARQSVLRYVCSRSARLPPPAPVQVPGNSGECSCSSLHSCFQAQLSCPLPASLSLVCPLCLLDSAQRSVLGKYIALSCAHPIRGSSSPPSHPVSGGPSILHSHSAIPPGLLGRACPHLAPSPSLSDPAPAFLFPSGSALCPISCSETSSHPACLLLAFPSFLLLGLFSPRLQGVHLSAVS